MFSCGCFKHKILLIRSPEPGRTHNPSGLMAFPVGSELRPAPAARVTRLWERRDEDDPEPLFTTSANTPWPSTHAHMPRPRAQEEKDPVYLFLESMMTCARVREYNSNPPPQVHLLPARRPDETVSDASRLRLSPQTAEPEPTKLLEIVSACNWEAHRSLVLKELFHHINTNRLASLHSIHVYRVELLSETLNKDENSSTLTYKVCVSLPETPENPPEPRQKRKHAACARKAGKVGKPNEDVVNNRQEVPVAPFPLLSRVMPAGCLRADRKTLGGCGPIKVHGKTYSQAKVLLGRMGALHPANRLAAYVTGRMKLQPPNASLARAGATQRPVRRSTALTHPRRTVSRAVRSKAAFKTPASKTLAVYKPPDGVTHTPTLFILSHVPVAPPANPNICSTSDHRTATSALFLNAVAPPLSGFNAVAPPLSTSDAVAPPLSTSDAVAPPLSTSDAVAPPLSSPDAVAPPLSTPDAQAPPLSTLDPVAPPLSTPLPASALPPGQQVVLQPVAGVTGVNMCQFNGRMIQLVPVSAAPPMQSSAGSAQQEVHTAAQLPQRTKPVWNQVSPKAFPVIAPRIGPVGRGTQNAFLPKNSFSFRICPPAAEGKTTGLEPPDSGGSVSSLLLPGGYRLIKLPMLVQPAVSPDEPTGRRSCSPVTEPDASPLHLNIIKVDEDSLQTDTSCERPCSDSETECVRVKVEAPEDPPVTDRSQQNTDPIGDSVKTEEPAREIQPGAQASETLNPSSGSAEAQPLLHSSITGAFSRPLFAGPISAFSRRMFPLRPAPAQPEDELRRGEVRLGIPWFWKRNTPAPDDPADDSRSAPMCSSDGCSSDDSNERSSEEDVDVEALEEEERRTPPAQRPRPPKGRLGRPSHHAVRVMCDLPLYKRSWRLNRALRARRCTLQLQRSVCALRRALCVQEHVSVSTEDLLRQTLQTIEALEQQNNSLMEQKRALIQQHSHYQTLISVAGVESAARQTAAAPFRRSIPVEKSRSRLPSVVLRSFSA